MGVGRAALPEMFRRRIWEEMPSFAAYSISEGRDLWVAKRRL